MGMWLQVLIDGMGHAVDWLKVVEVFEGVSIWSFVLSVLIIGILITSLVNVVKSNFSGRRRAEKGREGE